MKLATVKSASTTVRAVARPRFKMHVFPSRQEKVGSIWPQKRSPCISLLTSLAIYPLTRTWLNAMLIGNYKQDPAPFLQGS